MTTSIPTQESLRDHLRDLSVILSKNMEFFDGEIILSVWLFESKIHCLEINNSKLLRYLIILSLIKYLTPKKSMEDSIDLFHEYLDSLGEPRLTNFEETILFGLDNLITKEMVRKFKNLIGSPVNQDTIFYILEYIYYDE